MKRDSNGRFKKKDKKDNSYVLTIDVPSFGKIGKLILCIIILFPWFGIIIYRKAVFRNLLGIIDFLLDKGENSWELGKENGTTGGNEEIA